MSHNDSLILAIDDTAISLSLLVSFLSAEGYTVVQAECGETALALVRKRRPDLILLDIQMAGMDGMEVCRRLKDDAATKNIPIIFISAFADSEIWATGLQLGAADYIRKPFLKAELLSRVATHLSLAKMKQALEQQSCRLREVEEHTVEIESRYEELFEKSPIGKSMTLFDGTVVPNKSLCAMLGYSMEELQKMKWQDITPGEDIARTEDTIGALKNGAIDKAYFEKRYIRKDGSVMWGDVLSYVHHDLKGRPLHFITSVMDITERKNTQLALEERIRFTDQLLEATALSTWISDEHGTAVKANRACFKFFGAKPEEVIGKYNAFRDEVVEQQGAMPKIRHAYATGEPVTFFLDYDFGTVAHVDVRNATHKFIQVNLTPIKDATGKVTNVVSQSIDLTEIRHAEEALRLSEQKYRIVADNTYDMEVWRNPQGGYAWVSPSSRRITGYGPEAFLANPTLFESIVVKEDTPQFDHHLRHEVANRKHGSLEFRIIRADGEIRWIEHVCNPVFTDAGEYLGSRGSFRDITERKCLEAEQDDLRSKLNQAQKLDAIGQLAGGIAHDFNNILGGISGFNELLKLKHADNPETCGYIDKIIASIGKATYLTRQLLTFAHKAKGEPVEFSVNASITTVIEIAERTFDGNVVIRKALSETTPKLRADQNLFENCILNLLLNARDAMPGGGFIVVSTCGETLREGGVPEGAARSPGKYVVVSVADTGTGIDDATKKHLFEPFFTTKEQGKGTGLGLASVYGFVKQYGGVVDVESAVGRGAEFTLYFPVTENV